MANASALPNRLPYPLWASRNVNMAHTQVAECVVLTALATAGLSRDCGGLANALSTKRIAYVLVLSRVKCGKLSARGRA